ncbi:zinc ribbon domain-containing protein [Fibrobacterota bacterium]
MPVYEFFCTGCNTIYSFFSRTVNTQKRPDCPKCGRPELERRMSGFAVISGRNTEKSDGPDDMPIDEAKMENAITALASEAEKVREDDPKSAARLMRKFSDMTGLQYNESLQTALNRMESGEDPEAIEKDMGGQLENGEEPFILPDKKSAGKSRPAPAKDENLYDM